MNIKDKIYVATIAEDAQAMAEKYGVGIEINEFCTAANMDENFTEWDQKVRQELNVTERAIFHAPFNELHPSAIDPKIRQVAMDRLNQAYELAQHYNINRMVVHSGFLPEIYFPVWFIDRSVEFWLEFIDGKPSDFKIMIENQLEAEAELLPQLCEKINHPQISLCLDTGHALYKSKQDIHHWADCFAPHCSHVHLHNNNQVWDWHWCLNKGNIDMAEFLPYLLEKMPTATITLEHLQAADSFTWLQERGYL